MAACARCGTEFQPGVALLQRLRGAGAAGADLSLLRNSPRGKRGLLTACGALGQVSSSLATAQPQGFILVTPWPRRPSSFSADYTGLLFRRQDITDRRIDGLAGL